MTRPKFWPKPKTKTFFWDQIFQKQSFFPRPNFLKPKPSKNWQKFRNQEVSKPKCQSLAGALSYFPSQSTWRKVNGLFPQTVTDDRLLEIGKLKKPWINKKPSNKFDQSSSPFDFWGGKGGDVLLRWDGYQLLLEPCSLFVCFLGARCWVLCDIMPVLV